MINHLVLYILNTSGCNFFDIFLCYGISVNE